MIRKAKISDAKEIVCLNVKGWQETYKDIFPKSFLDNLNPYDENSIEKCKAKIQEYAVYEDKAKIIGIIRYGKNRKQYNDAYGEVYALYVDKDNQSKQIGTKLLKYAFKELKKKYKYVLISTLKENSANLFYQKTGGKLIGTSEYIIGDNKYPENIYKYNI